MNKVYCRSLLLYKLNEELYNMNAHRTLNMINQI